MYARVAATLEPFMPDVGQGLVAILDEEFRYLQRKKLVKELAEVRSKVRPTDRLILARRPQS